MKIALLCSGLGHVYRGHEIFAQDLFDLVKDSLDITLFKGGGVAGPRELVIPNIPRAAACLEHVQVAAAPKWAESIKEQERLRIEAETFSYSALGPLLEGNYDIIHCLEQEVCRLIYANRHLFKQTPKILFSNGGAIPARDLPPCDFVQEHTSYNLERSLKDRAFMIPHGVDTAVFKPEIRSDFRAKHGIPENAYVVLSVGTICFWHKRMDHVIREVAQVDNAYLVIVGQESPDSAAIKALGKELLGERVVFTRMQHEDLPQAYAAADVFTLGSLFETFGIVYIEAMAMGLPVFCTQHENQRSIVKEGVFVDMEKSGDLALALKKTDEQTLQELRKRGPKIAKESYDLQALKQKYIDRYSDIAAVEASLPKYSLSLKLRANLKNVLGL